MRELRDCSVHMIGLGLMGGSLAMALRGHVHRLTADDLNLATLESALEAGVIDQIGGLTGADIVVLAVPADRIVGLVGELSLPDRVQAGTLVIDLGSTKSRICAALDGLPERLQAVGGHPMCGLAENGYRNAIPTLYQGARFVLCETARTTPEARHLAMELVAASGAIPLWMERNRHDYLTALTSHLPHLLSFGLMRLAMEVAAEDGDLFQLAAGGFDGATRLARTEESMITGMFATNADQLRALAARLREHLDAVDALFEEPDALRQELAKIVEARRHYTTSYGERPIA
jgi:prephenate dehydrogenase